ncbi:MAG: tRNA (adenosine(37)-N6)-dimethylallyltransferase MiaA [Candidatus Dadabacteria bacterium]|nr:MAG: tRNA (adenosine(37)-N6)-dimethylallyltransferase MiaA [Candidatus Dadabacteria bacterium]
MVVSGRQNPVVVITGPTASGKSDLAIELCKEIDGEVISLDSVQVYKGLDIGSAKVRDFQGIRHHLIDLLPPTEQMDAARFGRLAREKVGEIFARGKRPVVAGGSGLYLVSFVDGLTDMPPADKELRERFRKQKTQDLYNRLVELDPEIAKELHPEDRIRIERALEVIAISGRKLSILRKEGLKERLKFPVVVFVLCWERERLYERINLRSRKLVDSGIVEEARGIIKEYGSRDLFPFRSVGYKEALEVINGNLKEEDLADAIAQATRRLAKRQMTFFRNQPEILGWECEPRQETLKKADKKPKSFNWVDLSFRELIDISLRGLELGLRRVYYIGGEALLLP